MNIQCDDSFTEMTDCGSFLGGKKKDVKILQINYCEAPNLAEFIISCGYLDRLVIYSNAMNFTQLDELCCSVGLPLVEGSYWGANSAARKMVCHGYESSKSAKVVGISLESLVAISIAVTVLLT